MKTTVTNPYRNENKGENEVSDTVGMIFTEEESKKIKDNSGTLPEKILVAKEQYKKGQEYSSLSEIFADKMDFDMSTIKEMVESLEEDNLNFRGNVKVDSVKTKAGYNLTPRDEKSQNSFEKIIKYMKKEISKIDAVKKSDSDPTKAALLMKDFISSLKKIELSPRVPEPEDNIGREEKIGVQPFGSPEIKLGKARSHLNLGNKDNSSKQKAITGLIKLEEQSESELESELRPKIPESRPESVSKDEENITKDFAEPTPNKLPPMSTFSSKNQTPDTLMPKMGREEFFNEKVSDMFAEFVIMKNKKQMSHTNSKEELKTPDSQTGVPREFLPNTPYDEENKGRLLNILSLFYLLTFLFILFSR